MFSKLLSVNAWGVSISQTLLKKPNPSEKNLIFSSRSPSDSRLLQKAAALQLLISTGAYCPSLHHMAVAAARAWDERAQRWRIEGLDLPTGDPARGIVEDNPLSSRRGGKTLDWQAAGLRNVMQTISRGIRDDQRAGAADKDMKSNNRKRRSYLHAGRTRSNLSNNLVVYLMNLDFKLIHAFLSPMCFIISSL